MDKEKKIITRTNGNNIRFVCSRCRQPLNDDLECEKCLKDKLTFAKYYKR